MSAWHGVPRVEEVYVHSATMHQAYMYARRYMDGRYFPRDINLARKWLMRADALGYPNISRDIYELHHKIFFMEGMHHKPLKFAEDIVATRECRKDRDVIKEQIRADAAPRKLELQKQSASESKTSALKGSKRDILDLPRQPLRPEIHISAAACNPRDIEKIIFTTGHRYGSKLFERRVEQQNISLLKCVPSDRKQIERIRVMLIEYLSNSREILMEKMIQTIRCNKKLASYNGSYDRIYNWMMEGIEAGIHQTEQQINLFIDRNELGPSLREIGLN